MDGHSLEPVNHNMSDNSRVSEALYVGLCRHIGTPTLVTIMRGSVDMEEIIKKPGMRVTKGLRVMDSGSNREGFRFESSDRDIMSWFIHHKVIFDSSQSSIYDQSKDSIILMKDFDTPPGFVRLQLLTSPQDEKEKYFASCIVPFDDKTYISSARWRQQFITMFKFKPPYNIKSHGPCATFSVDGLEHDNVLCFHCNYWSRLTY